jgi:hypothetical protein
MLSPELEFERVTNGLLPDFDLQEFKDCDEKLYQAIIETVRLFGELKYHEGVQDATTAAINVIRNHGLDD